MLFTSLNPIPDAMAATVLRAVQAVDAFAQVRFDASRQQIGIDGSLTAQEAKAALQSAGCNVVLADETITSGHVSGGSTCCGSCS